MAPFGMLAPSPPLSRGPAAIGAWWVVGLFFVAAVLSYTDRQILSLLVEPLRADLKISDTQVGVLQGVAFAIVYSFAGLPLGRVADVAPRKWVIVTGVALWSLGTLFCGYAGSFWALFAGRVVVGIGEAALAPAAMSMISDMFPAERRGLAIGFLIMGMVVGGGVAILVGGAVLAAAGAGALSGLPLLNSLAPWRCTLVLLGLLGAPLLTALWFVREPARLETTLSDRTERGFLAILKQLSVRKRALIPLVLGCALMSVGDFASLSWAPALLNRRFHLRPEQVALTLGPCIMLAGVLASVLGGALSDRTARRRAASGRLRLGALCAGLALPFAFLIFAQSATQLVAAVTLWSLFSTTAGAAGITAIQELVPNRARGLSTSFIAFGNIILGLGGGATMVGVVNDHLTHDPTSLGTSLTLVIAPCGVLAVALFALASRSARRSTACA